MKVSLIITTYNWKEALEMVLLSALNQTILPSEIIIADDGSRDDTKELIQHIAQTSPVPIIHSWQEDEGFRASRSRNLAIAKASGEYIIASDGDSILDPHFVEDHLHHAQENTYVQGSRVLLSPEFTKTILSSKKFIKPPFKSKLYSNKLNAIRNILLSNLIASMKSQKLKGIRSCNFSLFNKDILKVNGFNENFTSWGQEDSEFVQRLYHAGIQRKNAKFSAIQYHLYHKEGNSNAGNMGLLLQTIQSKLIYCDKGLDQHVDKENTHEN